MIAAAELAALEEGLRRAAANGHRMGELHEGLSIVCQPCLDCPADVALLKGSTELSGRALSDPCTSSIQPEVRCA